MPEIAKHIAVRQDPAGYSLCIDGEEFPWHITEDGVSTSVSRGGIPSVTLTLVADQVSVQSEGPLRSDRGRLARAEAAQDTRSLGAAPRDGAEELLDNAQKALQENHDTMAELRARIAELEGAEESPQAEKLNVVGTAYVEVLPDFSAVDELLNDSRVRRYIRGIRAGRRE